MTTASRGVIAGGVAALVLVASSPALGGASEGALRAQETGAEGAAGDSTGVPPLEDALTVYVLTAEPGDAIWEKFGHNALRIVDARAGTDISWNWGLFDFDQVGFVPRLIRGTMLYRMGGSPTERALEGYRATNRAVWMQELELTGPQKEALQRAVHTHALPENRYYRYDYYRDNCSTRVRDMVDGALGGLLKGTTEDRLTPHGYRWHTRRLLQGEPPAYAGIQLVLGNRADEPISVWDEMFLPMRFRERLRDVTVTDETGDAVPLVRREFQVVSSERPPVHRTVTTRLPWFLAVGLLWGASILGAARVAARDGLVGRWIFGTVTGAWHLAAGVSGAVLLAAWAFTDHVFWGWNENVLHTDPLSLAVLAGVIAFLGSGRIPRWLVRASATVAVLSVTGWILQLLPGLDQVNGEIIALALPPNLATAVAVLTALGRDHAAGKGAAEPGPPATPGGA